MYTVVAKCPLGATGLLVENTDVQTPSRSHTLGRFPGRRVTEAGQVGGGEGILGQGNLPWRWKVRSAGARGQELGVSDSGV